MAHLTCLENTQTGIDEWLRANQDAGVSNFMALRGDRPKDRPAKKGDFDLAYQLVEVIRRQIPNAGIGIAGYPENHPEEADATARPAAHGS